MAVTTIKIPQFANGTAGELLTWSSSGIPTTVATGTAGHVLTSNGAGSAPTFQAVSGGGSSSGIAGAVQFSGGSGTFSSDATNFFFDDTANQLQMNGGTSYGILISGQNGGVHVSPSSSITGVLNGFRVAANATGSINIAATNSNTSSSSAAARVVLTTFAGGGDPYMLFNTAEAGYSMGVDNDGGDKFFMGLGTSPSGMSTVNITMDAAKMGIIQTTPTAKLHISGGTATANTAPLKIDSGTAMTTPEDGAIEYHGSHLYFTIGSTRYQLDQQGGSISDGDKGDITVSSSGTVWTVDNLAITNAKINDVNVSKLTSGTLPASLSMTLSTAGLFTFAYSNANSAFSILDSSNSATIFSRNGSQYVSADNTSVYIGNGATFLEYTGGVLRLFDSDATQYIGVKPPATGSLTTSYTLTLPTTAGSANQVLYTDGSGNLAWGGSYIGGTGDVVGPASAVDSEIALFNATTGKLIKRSTGTGVGILTSGVLSTKTNPTGAFVGDTDTQTLTNKRINPREVTIISNSTPIPNSDTTDIYTITALAGSATFGAPTGTPVQGQKLIIRIKDNGTARALSYNAIYRAIGVILPTTTVISKTLYLGCIYNSTDTKWDVIAVANEA